VKDVTWLTPAGDEMTPEHWMDSNGRCLGVLLDGRAQETGVRRIGSDSTLLLILNSYDDAVQFRLPEAPGGTRWVRLIDTNLGDESQVEKFSSGHEYTVTGRSLLLFILEPTRTKGQSTDAERSYLHVLQAFEDASAELGPLLPSEGASAR
jgi:glycogen operon protein